MCSTSFQSNVQTEIKEFLRLAIPLASAQVAQSFTGFVDTIMMGSLGSTALAAGGLASLTFFALLSTASGVVMGVSPLVAQAYGAGNKSRVEQVARQGLWLSLVLTIPMMILIGHMGPIMRQLQSLGVAIAAGLFTWRFWQHTRSSFKQLSRSS